MAEKRKRVSFATEEEPPAQAPKVCDDEGDGYDEDDVPEKTLPTLAPITADAMAKAATDEAALRKLAAQAKLQREKAQFEEISSKLGLGQTGSDTVVVAAGSSLKSRLGSDEDEEVEGEEGEEGEEDEDEDEDEDDDEDDDDEEDEEKRRIKAEIARRESKHEKARPRVTHVFGEEGASDRKDVYNREMGSEMEPFNLKSERSQGYFDESGGFIWRKKDTDDVSDPWLAEIDQEKILSHVPKTSSSQVDDTPAAPPPKSELFARVLSYLQDGETVPTALRRLKGDKSAGGGGGAGRGGGGWREKLAATKAAKASGQSLGGSFASATDKAAFDALTEASDMLMAMGLTYIYQERKERLQDRYSNMPR